MNYEGKILAKYRYEKAIDTFNAAEALFSENRFNHAVNRYYYTVFHAIQALLATIGSKTKKHSGAIAEFNRHFVKTGIFDKNYAKMVKHLFEERGEADYRDFKVFQKQEVEELRADVTGFLQAVRDYLSREHWLE